MSIKSLFFTSSDEPKKNDEQNNNVTSATNTPITTSFGFNETNKSVDNKSVTIPVDLSNDYYLNTLSVYENGFENLNQPGYDFYEFYRAVTVGGIHNPSSYAMAFGMGTAMDKTITKEKLLTQSEFYLNEIIKVHEDFKNKGNQKHNEIITQKRTENETLISDLNSLKLQMEQLQVQIDDRERKLSIIDSKYDGNVNEVVGKLTANDKAKDTLLNTIREVKEGIIKNLK